MAGFMGGGWLNGERLASLPGSCAPPGLHCSTPRGSAALCPGSVVSFTRRLQGPSSSSHSTASRCVTSQLLSHAPQTQITQTDTTSCLAAAAPTQVASRTGTTPTSRLVEKRPAHVPSRGEKFNFNVPLGINVASSTFKPPIKSTLSLLLPPLRLFFLPAADVSSLWF